MSPRAAGVLPRAVSDVVAGHALFKIEAIDRLLLNLYVPTLQHPRALVGYVHTRLRLPIASTAPLAAVSARFEKAIHAFAAVRDIPVVHLVKGQRKDDVAHQYLERFLASGRREGLLFIGRAQEKTPVFRTEKRRGADGGTYPWIVKTIRRIPHSHRYRVTDTGLAQAMFLARAHDRLLTTGLAELTAPAASSRMQHASRVYQAAMDELATRAGLHIAA